MKNSSKKTLPSVTFVLGGAASGKSAFAEKLILESGLAPVYIATSQVLDAEMAGKVSDHQRQRGDGWTTIEEPFDLPTALASCSGSDATLIDCATLWLTNIMLDARDLAKAQTTLIAALDHTASPVVIVSNEVGAGIVPDNRLGRQFRNAQGRLNQLLAARADLVVQVIAGLPLVLKGELPE